MSDPAAIRVLVSACLLGERVRYHGGDARSDHPILDLWLREGRVIPHCPEVAGGLPTPREPAEIETGATALDVWSGNARVLTRSGRDVTAEFVRGARLAVERAQASGARVAVLKDGSPSCAVTATYDGSFRGVKIPGLGVTAAALREAGIAVFSEAQWEDAARVVAAVEEESW